MVIHGDCLIELKNITDKSVDLVYLDPPFFTQKKQNLKTRDNSKEYSFDDTWDNINKYRTYIQDRLVECRRVLKDTGSIFLHCDKSAAHQLRVALDEIFGTGNFQSEIVWSYKRWSNAKKGLLNSHQIILFYSKTDDFKFNTIYDEYSPTTNIDQIFQKRMRDQNGKTKYKESGNGGYELTKEKKGVPLSDVWEIPYLNPKAMERVGYPTQKPILLLERIIKISTDENDLVLDPFCGSGTTLVAAKFLNRKYIGIDNSRDAIELTKNRLENPIKSESHLLQNGKDAYRNQKKEVVNILNKIDAVPVQRNRGIDGFLRIDNLMVPIPIKVQRESETISEAMDNLMKSCQRNKYAKKILIKTHTRQNQLLFDTLGGQQYRDIIIVDDIEGFRKNKNELLTQMRKS
ncbi:MAG: DNA methyltransferase [Candidatus Komeilibacteria bacterium RIFCSPLOWO2_02_FULL_48_11]|uniref:Methyltransferase n=1 Tax=Candidatus Komeilibacteria bacterium RIFCSPLOWO2_02_FULL_48_11 TaxID=1798553 RepID=A0A1G2BQX5_9BACT|nr:MAG: DNA methyltransferase [Candidatus Komeilibacteria bacterium RIFCSPLOWO2_02_FULL_48_11]